MSNGRMKFEIPALAGIAVPVDVSNANGVAVGSVLSTSTFRNLPAGNYFVAARLPSGTQLSTGVEVLPNKTTKVLLESPDLIGYPTEAAVAESAGGETARGSILRSDGEANGSSEFRHHVP